MYIIHYKTSKTGLLQTQCKVTGYLIGGYYCVNCPRFGSKQKKLGSIYCNASPDAVLHGKKIETKKSRK